MRTKEELLTDIKNSANIYEIKDVLIKIVEFCDAEKEVRSPQVDLLFKQELINLKGIGKLTAEDIIKYYPSKTSLVMDIQNKIELPFRNNINKILLQNYG